MRKAGKVASSVMVGALLCAEARAVTPDSPKSSNPYQGIVDRNVFGLKEPPPPAPPPEQPKPPVNITLTGITTLLGKKRAFMTLMGSPKPGAPPVTTSYMLTEGQREGDIAVVQIDEINGVVQLKQADAPVTISFKENGVKGGAPPPGNQAMQAGTINPGFQPNPFSPSTLPGQKTIPGRPLRIPGSVPGTEGNTPGYQGNSALGSPTSSFSPSTPQGTIQGQTPAMSAQEAELMLEAEHAHAVSKGDPSAALFPPTANNPTRNLAPDDLNPNQNPTSPSNPQMFRGRNRRPF